MRAAGVKTIEEANRYLEDGYLVWWEREMTVEAVNPDDAHRPLDKSHNLAASLSHVEMRQVRNDYTFRWDGKFYQIHRQAVVTGMRRGNVRVEKRLNGSLAARFGQRYLPIEECAIPAKAKPAAAPKVSKTAGKRKRAGRWDNHQLFSRKGTKLWQAAEASGYRREANE
jgi:hypothetical protein